ncbi:hypothetical protein JOH50_006256 [Rhizobium leguminosarum]|nr:hypothetical protein [Rhizobium leguminosarum]
MNHGWRNCSEPGADPEETRYDLQETDDEQDRPQQGNSILVDEAEDDDGKTSGRA